MNDMHDLNQLRVLDALLTERSVTGAARRLGRTQPALSHALARLRETHQDPLLVRSGRGMALTPRAEALAPRLRLALRGLEDAVRAALPFDPASTRRSFRVATADYAELVLLPRLIPRLEREAPGVDLWLRRPMDDLTGLADSDTDVVVGLAAASVLGAGVICRPLFSDRFVVIMRADHPLSQAPLTVEAYAAARHAFIAPRGGPGGVVDDALAKLGLSRRVALAIPHFLVAPYVVAGSDLVLTLAERVARAFASHLPLTIVEPPLPLPRFTISLMWHERHHADLGHAWLRSTLAEVARLQEREGATDNPSQA